MEKKMAIIDLGSNSIRMNIIKINKNGAYKMIEQEKEMVRLSEGMGKELTLKSSAIERTVYTLKLFKKLIDAHKVDKVISVATAAVRNARNQKKFLTRVKKETGFDFRVLSGTEEAFFDYLGVVNTINIDSCLIIDIGGASTELVWVENRKLKKTVSLPYGAVVLTETFLEKDLIPPEKIRKLESFLVKRFLSIDWLKNVTNLPIIGLGGTIRTLAKIDKKEKKFPLEKLHNYIMKNTDVFSIYNKIINFSLKERKKIPGLKKNRADIIVGGLIIIKKLMELTETENLIISGNGLREGVFYYNYFKDLGFEKGFVPNILEQSINNVLKNYEVNIKHSYHVQKLALSLFDQTKTLHGLGENERKILAVGSLLHDIGIYVDYYKHHKHGFYLVLNSKINGLTLKELLMTAFIVAMHRNEEFKKSWKEYKMVINKEDYEVITKLSLFTRIAENLDRNEFESIDDLECKINQKCVQIKLLTQNTPELEIAAAMKSEKDFKKLFKKNLSFTIAERGPFQNA